MRLVERLHILQVMRRWILWIGVGMAVLVAALAAAAWMAARHFQPFVRDQAIRYLQDRFGRDVQLGSFRVSLTVGSPLKLETAIVRVSGEHLSLPPFIMVGKFRMDAPLTSLWSEHPRVHEVRLEQLAIDIPPKGERPAIASPQGSKSVSIGQIQCLDVELRIHPADPAKQPRVFLIHDMRFKGAGEGRPMPYQASLRNPTPPGEIRASGEFGPWQREDPGLTSISGDYQFRHADLGVFHRIAGTLNSDGKFHGVLRRIEVDGTTSTSDFRLTGGTPLPLNTHFHSIVDGLSGDTYLQPVDATIGNSHLTARGRVIRPPGAAKRTVDLDVVMTKGRIEDLLHLAVKSKQPLMRGAVALRTKLDILPRQEAFSARLLLDGTFNMDEAHFMGGSVQEKIDSLSRRAQGQPKNEEISDVFSSVRGGFDLRDGELTFSALTFQVPGAAVHLHGSYGLDSEQIDLHGIARLQAKVSQTMTGWKRLALKPVDPFFSKAGAGTLLPIKITGTREKPQFGLDRKK